MKVGDKVLCIAKFKDQSKVPYYILPSVGNVYTIRGFTNLSVGGFLLDEIINDVMPTTKGFLELGFVHYKFIKWDLEEIESLVEAEVQHN